MNAVDFDLAVAKAAQRRGNVTDAELLYKQILDQNPDCAEAVHFLGVAAMHKGQLDEAHRLMKQSVGLSPTVASFTTTSRPS